MLYYVQFETQITVEAESFQDARDRAIKIWHGDIPLSELGPEEGKDTDLAYIEDENGKEEDGADSSSSEAEVKAPNDR